ncbi:unnamed protein product [Heterobilharzia americana]|nr:unnamed protein product [Heterobilharzia americana]
MRVFAKRVSFRSSIADLPCLKRACKPLATVNGPELTPENKKQWEEYASPQSCNTLKVGDRIDPRVGSKQPSQSVTYSDIVMGYKSNGNTGSVINSKIALETKTKEGVTFEENNKVVKIDTCGETHRVDAKQT